MSNPTAHPTTCCMKGPWFIGRCRGRIIQVDLAWCGMAITGSACERHLLSETKYLYRTGLTTPPIPRAIGGA